MTSDLYTEEQLLMLSALQHLAFCERQCALIHIEGIWSENRLTAEGRILHDRVHEQDAESRGDLRIARGLRLRSLKLGLTGQADVVEFHRQADGKWLPFPVEYKRGRPKPDICDEIQLCAQAMCLEEMLNVSIPKGAIFYGKPRRRHAVDFSDTLRREVEVASARLHQLIEKGVTPPAEYERKCERCSLKDDCMPRLSGSRKSAVAYLEENLRDETIS